jgi:3-deoxy-manno-octulosonate cytidylyltransferase (CMP-KDO synthetase)
MSDMSKPRVIAIIPARFASTRYPGKVIAPLLGHPLVYHTWLRASQASLVDQVIVATDSPEVGIALAPYPIEVVMTRDDHATGTDRIAEVAAELDAEIVVNVQGDEPAIDPAAIDAVIQPLLDDPALHMATARRAITDAKTIADPNVVKVICDSRSRAIYFSRLPIPYIRDEADRAGNPACYWQHIGLYVYRRDFLLAYTRMAQTPLENLEKLEQLRALENGHAIAVIETNYEVIGVDVPDDLVEVSALLQRRAAKENE